MNRRAAAAERIRLSFIDVLLKIGFNLAEMQGAWERTCNRAGELAISQGAALFQDPKNGILAFPILSRGY
jgi:hypothetical protein